jgi:hypothetical protein
MLQVSVYAGIISIIQEFQYILIYLPIGTTNAIQNLLHQYILFAIVIILI